MSELRECSGSEKVPDDKWIRNNPRMSAIDLNCKRPPYKRTDFRYEVWLKERKALRAKAKKQSFKVEMTQQPKKAVNAVCVDTTKARSTIDVLRICLKELGWREVRKDYTTKDNAW